MAYLEYKKHGYEYWSGERPIGKLERQAYERHNRDLKDGHKRGLWFDEEQADFVVALFDKYIRFVEGEWYGQKFKLSPWEEFVIRSLFGWMALPEGMSAARAKSIPRANRLRHGIFRRFRVALIEVARKNGKTPLAAAIAIILEAFDREPAAQVYSVATKKDQARLCFNTASRMVKQSRELLKRMKVFRSAISVDAIDATFQPLSSDYNGLDGLNTHGAIIDELHAHKTRMLWDVIESSCGSRRQSLIAATTTAGVGRTGICWKIHQDAEDILDPSKPDFQDDTFFAFITSNDKDDDWASLESRLKANPNYGISVKPKFLDEKLAIALRSPGYQNTYRRYYLNQWTEQVDRWMDMDAWRQSGGPVVDEDSLAGRTCYVGVDLSRTIDLTAAVAVFPPCKTDNFWRVVCRAWVPGDRVAARVESDKVPYDLWIRDGFITPTPGNVIDYDYVQAEIEMFCDKYDVREIGYDPWNAAMFATNLQKSGVKNLVEVRQGFQTLSPAMKEVEKLVYEHLFAHGNNPVLDWCMGNVCVRLDANENFAPDKAKSTERIDAVSALMTAMARAVVNVKPVSRYLTHGFRFLGGAVEDAG